MPAEPVYGILSGMFNWVCFEAKPVGQIDRHKPLKEEVQYSPVWQILKVSSLATYMWLLNRQLRGSCVKPFVNLATTTGYIMLQPSALLHGRQSAALAAQLHQDTGGFKTLKDVGTRAGM